MAPRAVAHQPDVAEDAHLAESVSIAMLTVLETLGPVERAVFVLREVFDTPYEEIAEVVGKTPGAARQIAHRAREHVALRRPRMQVDRALQRLAVEKFMAALNTGDVGSLLEVLAPEVVLIADGGGQVAAARKPIVGAEKVLVFLAHAARMPDLVASPAWLNGMPGVRIDVAGLTIAVSLAVKDGRIIRIFAIANPLKLGWLDRTAVLCR